MVLVQRTASVRGVTSLAPAMLTTKVADANLRSVMISPCRPLFDIKAALIGTLLSVSLLAQPAQPAMAAEGLPSIGMPSVVRAKTFQEASVDVAMDAYPLVKSLKAGPVASLGTKVVSLAATGDSREIIQTIDAGLDAFLSVPPDRFLKTVVALKEATAVASSAPTCNLVCMPPPPYVEKVVVSASDALSMTNPDKLKAFFFRGAASLASGEKQQYAGVLAETVKFSFSVDKSQLGKFKDDGYELLLAIDNAASSAPPKKMPTTKPFPKNAAVEQVALELADGLYPIVQGLQAKPVAALAGKVISLAASGDPKEIIKTIDAGLDAFLSVPIENFFSAALALKSATTEAVVADSCNLVCTPSLATVERVAGKMATALSVTDSEKLKAFVYQITRSLQSGDKTQLAAVLANGRQFEASLDQGDVRKVTLASIQLLKAAGAPLSESEVAWVKGLAGIS